MIYQSQISFLLEQARVAKTRGYKRHHQVQVIQDDIVGVMLAAISVEVTSIILIIFCTLLHLALSLKREIGFYVL